MPSLQIRAKRGGAAHEISLSNNGGRIGRGPNCDVRLPDRDVSLTHAQLTLTPQEAFIEDLQSTNGTVLNGKRLTAQARAPLRDGDLIEIGGYVLTYSRQSGGGSPADLARELARELLGGEAQGPSITVLNGPQMGLRTSFAEAQIDLLIGRGEECDLPLVDAGASRRHARLRRSLSGVMVEDLGSTHGTQVDGRSLSASQQASLHDRSEIVIGQTRLAFHDPEEALLTSLGHDSGMMRAVPVPKEDKPAPRRDSLSPWSARERALLWAAGGLFFLAALFASLFAWEV